MYHKACLLLLHLFACSHDWVYLQGIGEPPLFLSSSIFFAIKDAISCARKEVGIEGYFRLDSPATAERIRMSCTDQFTQKVNNQLAQIYIPFLLKHLDQLHYN